MTLPLIPFLLLLFAGMSHQCSVRSGSGEFWGRIDTMCRCHVWSSAALCLVVSAERGEMWSLWLTSAVSGLSVVVDSFRLNIMSSCVLFILLGRYVTFSGLHDAGRTDGRKNGWSWNSFWKHLETRFQACNSGLISCSCWWRGGERVRWFFTSCFRLSRPHIFFWAPIGCGWPRLELTKVWSLR